MTTKYCDFCGEQLTRNSEIEFKMINSDILRYDCCEKCEQELIIEMSRFSKKRHIERMKLMYKIEKVFDKR